MLQLLNGAFITQRACAELAAESRPELEESAAPGMLPKKVQRVRSGARTGRGDRRQWSVYFRRDGVRGLGILDLRRAFSQVANAFARLHGGVRLELEDFD